MKFGPYKTKKDVRLVMVRGTQIPCSIDFTLRLSCATIVFFGAVEISEFSDTKS